MTGMKTMTLLLPDGTPSGRIVVQQNFSTAVVASAPPSSLAALASDPATETAGVLIFDTGDRLVVRSVGDLQSELKVYAREFGDRNLEAHVPLRVTMAYSSNGLTSDQASVVKKALIARFEDNGVKCVDDNPSAAPKLLPGNEYYNAEAMEFVEIAYPSLCFTGLPSLTTALCQPHQVKENVFSFA